MNMGKAKLSISSSPIFEGMRDNEIVRMSHGDKAEKLPNGFEVIGSSENSPYAGIANEEKKIYAFQFHPEKSGEIGLQIINNFIKITKGEF